MTVDFGELGAADGRRHFGQTQVGADHVGQVADGEILDDVLAVISDHRQAAREIFVFGDADAAFTGVNVLVIVEAEHTDMADRAGAHTVLEGAGRLGAVFDKIDAVGIGEGAQFSERGGMAEQVDREDGPRPVRDRGPH